MHLHTQADPSEWIRRWSHLIPAHSHVLDVACGHGRHMRWLSELGHRVTGVDQSAQALEVAQAWGTVKQADIENGPWPFAADPAADGGCLTFDAVVVCNYLWRALMPTLTRSVRQGGVFMYETFAAGNETVGKPSRPDFLLQRGELLKACQHMHIVAYEDVRLSNPDRFVQRIVAIQP